MSCIVVLGCLVYIGWDVCVLSTIWRRNFELNPRLSLHMSSLLYVDDSHFGGCFSWEFFIVLFSSYVDDIAFYKNLMWGAPVVASSATGTSCPLFCSFLGWC